MRCRSLVRTAVDLEETLRSHLKIDLRTVTRSDRYYVNLAGKNEHKPFVRYDSCCRASLSQRGARLVGRTCSSSLLPRTTTTYRPLANEKLVAIAATPSSSGRPCSPRTHTRAPTSGAPIARARSTSSTVAPCTARRGAPSTGAVLCLLSCGAAGANSLDVLRSRLDLDCCLLYTSPSPRDGLLSRMPSSA